MLCGLPAQPLGSVSREHRSGQGAEQAAETLCRQLGWLSGEGGVGPACSKAVGHLKREQRARLLFPGLFPLLVLHLSREGKRRENK